MKNKKKIRFLINTLGGGGAEKVLVDLLRNLSPEEYDLSLVVVSGGETISKLPPHVKVHDITGIRISWLRPFLQYIVYRLPDWLFCALFLRGKYDVEVAYLEGSPTKKIATLKTKAKKVAFVHQNVASSHLYNSCYKNAEACYKEYQKFHDVCFVSEQAKRGFETAVGLLSNARVLYNFIDTDLILKMAEDPCPITYQTNGRKLISVGRLSEEKNYGRLLRAISKLEEEYSLELWILGEGKERAALERMIQELGIASVRLLGFRENPFVYMKNADLYVCASNTEGYNTAICEAVILGVPVITTDCAGMGEILENGRYGRIVENTDEALYLGLKQVLDDPQMYDDLKTAVQNGRFAIKEKNSMEGYRIFFGGM